MRIVLDTNVLIAAYATRGQCHEIMEHCIRMHTVVSSDILLTELSEKLTKKLRFTPEVTRELIALLQPGLTMVDPVPLRPPVCRDPDDDWVIATAVSGDCECIVTGDKDLLVLHPFGSLAIIPPGGFWRFESSS